MWRRPPKTSKIPAGTKSRGFQDNCKRLQDLGWCSVLPGRCLSNRGKLAAQQSPITKGKARRHIYPIPRRIRRASQVEAYMQRQQGTRCSSRRVSCIVVWPLLFSSSLLSLLPLLLLHEPHSPLQGSGKWKWETFECQSDRIQETTGRKLLTGIGHLAPWVTWGIWYTSYIEIPGFVTQFHYC